MHGNHRSTISPYRGLPAAATGQCESLQSTSTQRDSVCRRAWLQVAGPTETVWQLAYHLHPYESLVQSRRAGSTLHETAGGTDHPHQDRGNFLGQHYRQGASRRNRRVKKYGPQAIGKSRGGWTTKIHMVAADARTAITFSLSPSHAHDAPEGCRLLRTMAPPDSQVCLLMDRAYEGKETRQLALELGFTPVVPPKQNRISPWDYDRAMYRRRNEIERLFRRLKGFRRILSRFDKLDVMFIAFIHFALIAEALR